MSTSSQKSNNKVYKCTGDWYLYTLASINSKYPRNTYVGITNNLEKRLRQHNGKIKGGARSTQIAKPWRHIAYISGFPDHGAALRAEWSLKVVNRQS